MSEQKQQQNAFIIYRARLFRRRKSRPVFWSFPRPEGSWLDFTFYDDAIPENEFKKRLRMSKDTFRMLVNICQVNLMRKNTKYRACLPPDKVLAIGLYRLAHGASTRVCADAFNIGQTTVLEAFQDVVSILNTLKNNFIKFPRTDAEKICTINSFKSRSEMPNVLGAIDGTHIKIRAPKENKRDYFSRYHQYDVVCQGIVDGNTKFIDLVAGFPGSMHDSRVLRNTRICRLLDNGFGTPLMSLKDKTISPYLVGDSAYPLSKSIIKPFSDSTSDPDEKKFNRELSRARVAVECAFGGLKSRFRILNKTMEDGIKMINQTIVACCVLHNICVDYGDIWDEMVNDETPDAIGLQSNNLEGEEFREFLKQYISKTACKD